MEYVDDALEAPRITGSLLGEGPQRLLLGGRDEKGAFREVRNQRSLNITAGKVFREVSSLVVSLGCYCRDDYCCNAQTSDERSDVAAGRAYP